MAKNDQETILPADAKIISYELMRRAIIIRKLAADLYTWLPPGLWALRKVEYVLLEELDRDPGRRKPPCRWRSTPSCDRRLAIGGNTHRS